MTQTEQEKAVRRGSMLREIRSVSDAGQKRRRWFSDEYFDLMVWFGPHDVVSGFQLCYDKKGVERALTWMRAKGFMHERADDGEADSAKSLSPILVPDGLFPVHDVMKLFDRESSGIDQDIRSLVLDRFSELEGR